MGGKKLFKLFPEISDIITVLLGNHLSVAGGDEPVEGSKCIPIGPIRHSR